MSVLYRAIWTDSPAPDPAVTLDVLRECVAGWTQEISSPPALPEGRSVFQVSQGRRREVMYRSIGASAFEVSVTDQAPDEQTEWLTDVRIVADDEGIHTLVELSMSSDDLALRVSVGRPRLVHELLTAAAKPRLGGSGLLTEPLSLPANGVGILTDLLSNPDRALPMIVFTEPVGSHDQSWLQTAKAVAGRSQGVAVVVTLNQSAVSAFKEKFGSLAIWDGGARVYAPGIVTPESEGWRHRYYLRSRFDSAPTSTIDRIVYSVAQLSTRRRVPDHFRIFARQNEVALGLDGSTVPATVLSDAMEEWEFELEIARDEQSTLERELTSANGHLSRLKDALIERGLADLFWGTKHAQDTSVPDEVQYTSEAALAAQMYLSDWLTVPDSAIRELEDIDTAPESYNWGNKTWRGLRALAAYAKDRAEGWDKGGFWEWCASGPVLGWPATSKKLSMTESEGVQTGGKFKGTRDFKVSPEVDLSGVVTMLAHLKISEGGGNLAPRVYFYDDTSGPTRKVHVGLIGPHYLVPNKSTN